jgi:FkbM family methyltransferase
MTSLEYLKMGMHAIPRAFGFEFMRTRSMNRLMNPAGPRRAVVLRYHGIQTVVDVGANTGQYGAELREWGFQGRIVSFEPTGAAFKTLAERAATDPHWSVFNFALGAEQGTAEINVASNEGASSSLMPMLEKHRQSAPEVKYVATEQVAVRTLDSALEDIVTPEEILLLKMDVQGYEHFVLRGATSVLAQVRAIECELSLVPLYEGQLLLPQMLALLDSLGFQPVSFNPFFLDPVSGHCLQVDCLFARVQDAHSGNNSSASSGA